MLDREYRTMSSTQILVGEFIDRLAELSVTAELVDEGEVEAAVKVEMRGPTVGTELPFDGVTLPDGVTGDPSVEEITSAETGITPGSLGVANYGSVVVTPTPNWEGPVSLYPPKHIVVMHRSDIVPDIGSALERLSVRFDGGANDAVFVTGLSSTGDMGASITGVHGPSEMHVVVIDE
ncbi:MAG: LUD domain-containing protein [Natronomonas sp.]|uniref:LUD domain-containing protein n=1 Tax=Natronomonas sp. TaxID=2184060 RepID=UPI00286FB166|nr:LUD domain-containing protein [Natronomonas sp.]MDR9429417.1 LUD domain-containing protein [Natronomonas sp.]